MTAEQPSDMRRALDVANFWRWLPGFRAVAEKEHLTRAAESLFVSPSALSRTISLLEEHLDRPLFHREGRRLRLTQHGRIMLEAVRSAMRLVHDGLTRVSGTVLSGETRVSVPFELMPAVERALARLSGAHPALIPILVTADESEVNTSLLRGELDVALVRRPTPGPHIELEQVALVPRGVYCGRGHALFGGPEPELTTIAEHGFVAPIAADDPYRGDGWPLEEPRVVRLYASDLLVPLSVCTRGELLAVLPDRVAATAVEAGELRRLGAAPVRPLPVFAVRRIQLSEHDLASRVIDAVREELVAA